MIPAAHQLGHPRHFFGTYTANCACGLSIYQPTLPELWQIHDVHLTIVRAMSRANHPSRRSS